MKKVEVYTDGKKDKVEYIGYALMFDASENCCLVVKENGDIECISLHRVRLVMDDCNTVWEYV